MAGDWKLTRAGAIMWRGQVWREADSTNAVAGNPEPSRADLRAYMARCEARYPGETPGILLGKEDERAYRQGGPWRYLLPDGETGVIHTERKADALGVLRHKLGRKRLPAGTTWEIAE